jgi:hypothetical protein
MKSKENWVENIVVFLVVALVYSVLNSVKYSSSSSPITYFGITFVESFFLLLFIYFFLSLTKLGQAVKIIITGFLEPIVVNVGGILSYGYSWNVYPLAFFDSVIIILLLAGGYFLFDRIWGKRK